MLHGIAVAVVTVLFDLLLRLTIRRVGHHIVRIGRLLLLHLLLR